MQIVILAAGNGTRMRHLTENGSKGMVNLVEKPMLHAIVERFGPVAEEIILVVNRKQKDIMDYFSGFPNVTFAYQEEPLGTANAVAAAEHCVKNRFMVINGDELIPEEDIKAFAQLDDCAIAACPVKHPEKFAVLHVARGCLKGIKEKPNVHSKCLVSSGMYLFDKRIFDAIRKTNLSVRGEYEITDSIRILIESGVKFRVFELSRWNTVNSPEDLEEALKCIE